MRAAIGNSLITKLLPSKKQYDVRDTKLTGFLVRVNPSGSMSYVCEYKRGQRINLGKVRIITPAQARDKAKEILGDATKGIYPHEKKKIKKVLTLKKFINEEYAPWFEMNRKSSKKTLFGLEKHFIKNFGDYQLHEITSLLIDKWRTKMLQNEKKSATVNRYIDSLKAALSKAMEWGFVDFNPVSGLKRIKVDTITRARFLSDDEDYRLRQALNCREKTIKQERDQANKWRKSRGYPELTDLREEHFADYLKPMTLIAKNTGIRRNELFSIDKKDINLTLKILMIAGSNAKNSTTRYIPLNEEAFETLKKWIAQTDSSGLLFKNKDDKKFTDIKKSWNNLLKLADIKNFRWHDLRHDFASKLVMAGVDLNTVRELLGHSDIRMTLRYSHLAPGHKADAVAELIQNKQKT